MKCSHDVGNVCQGKYKGFGCIEHKCELYQDRCEHLEGDYCQKFKKFYCVGRGECGTEEEYLSSLRTAGFK